MAGQYEGKLKQLIAAEMSGENTHLSEPGRTNSRLTGLGFFDPNLVAGSQGVSGEEYHRDRG